MEKKATLVNAGKTNGLDFDRPRSMVYQIYKTLGRAIATGDMAPGQLLREEELQKAFKVSRAPIREAIRLLEADDLVTVDAFRKKYVRPVTRQYLQDIVPVMACLEGYAANLAAKHITKEQIDMLTKINEQMRDAVERKDYSLCAELNFNFHGIYVKAAPNEALLSTIRSIKKKIIWFWLTNFYFNDHKVIPISITEHSKIIQEFTKRDGNRAEAIVRKHILGMVERSLKSNYFDSEGLYITKNKDEKG